MVCRDGEIGRRTRLKIWRQKWRAGSTPAPGTSLLPRELHLSLEMHQLSRETSRKRQANNCVRK